MIDLDLESLGEVRRILKAYVPGVEVRIFGSRVDGTARKYSDMDLVLFGRSKIDTDRIEALKDAFSVSDLPIQVDILDWNSISVEFQKVIEKHYEVIQPAA